MPKNGASDHRGSVLLGLSALCIAAGATLSFAVQAETWQGQLQGGGEIRVDPDTHRAIGSIGGRDRPLWDGVHRLDDGSTVIIRDGIAVPTESMYERWTADRKPEPTFETRYCDQLVRKTCGFDNACNTAAACLRARTLLADEVREQRDWAAGRVHPNTATSQICLDALADSAFPACASLASDQGNSRCRPLVVKVCGTDDSCADSQACDAARQLQAMETEERLINDEPSAVSLTGSQCLEAMDNAFFTACGASGTGGDEYRTQQ